MIYIASPYSHPDPTVRAVNYRCALFYAAFLKQRGLNCFSPIAYGHQFASVCGLDTDAKTWLSFNTHMLRHSTEMRVLKLKDWNEAEGIKEEMRQCYKLRIPIRFIDHLTFKSVEIDTPPFRVG